MTGLQCHRSRTTVGVLAIVIVVSLSMFLAPSMTATATLGPDGETLVVDDAVDTVGVTACDGARYPTIQSAVDVAAPGDTVRVCAGNYTEQVVIDTANLTVRGQGEATVHTLTGWAFEVNTAGVTVRNFDVFAPGKGGIRVRGQNTLIRGNTVTAAKDGVDSFDVESGGGASARLDPGVLAVGETAPRTLDPFSHNTPGTDGDAVFVTGDGAVIRGNSIPEHGTGIVIWGADDVVIRGNLVRDSLDDEPEDGIVVLGNASATIVHNTVTANEDGIVPAGDVTILENNISANRHDGVDIGPRFGVDAPGTARVRVLRNEITSNGGYYGIPGAGIRLRRDDWKQADIKISDNVIRNNVGFGIHNEEIAFNNNHTVVNATNNYWGCGGPSSGLQDPYTERVANGSGDPVSAGKDPGVSNVHFDPFRERASCISTGLTPTPTPSPEPSTPTPTSTPTVTGTGPTATATTTQTPTSAPTTPGITAGGPGAGGGQGDRLGGDETGEDTVGNGAGSDSPGDATPTPRPTPTSTPSPTLPPTATPTPVTEPGFGVIGGIAGATVLGGFLALRRRSNRHYAR